MNLSVDAHANYVKRFVRLSEYNPLNLDVVKCTPLFFSVCALDLLEHLEIIDEHKPYIKSWLYQNFFAFEKQDGSDNYFVLRRDGELVKIPSEFDPFHVTMIHLGLALCFILDDDLSQLNREAILNTLSKLQLANGCIQASATSQESDLRFVYSACCICFYMNDWSHFNIDTTCKYIRSCLNYEGAFGFTPDSEAHGGSTFCAVASLYLMKRLRDVLCSKDVLKIIRWCLNRQTVGFSGRSNKPADSCYSFWIGATLEILHYNELCDRTENERFLLTAECDSGGYSKWPGFEPDPLHTYMSISALGVFSHPKILPVNSALIVSNRVYTKIKNLHSQWSIDLA